MAFYDALIAAWNGATQPPTGVVSGTAITGGMTTQQKVAAVNSWMIVGPARRMVLPPADLLNACVAADLEALTSTQINLLQLMLSGSQVDISNGTTLRQMFIDMFSSTSSIGPLAALALTYDSPHIPWITGVGGFLSPITVDDAVGAGLS